MQWKITPVKEGKQKTEKTFQFYQKPCEKNKNKKALQLKTFQEQEEVFKVNSFRCLRAQWKTIIFVVVNCSMKKLNNFHK